MHKHLTAACVVVLLTGLAAASTASQASSALQLKQLSDCRILPFAQIAGVIGPLNKETAQLMPKNLSFGKWWNCEVTSRATFARLNAFCHQPKQVAQVLFKKYARGDLEGKGGLTWSPVKGLGDKAVIVHLTHDVYTGGGSTSYVVQRRNDIFFIIGSIGMKGMPQAQLLRLTRLALRYNCE